MLRRLLPVLALALLAAPAARAAEPVTVRIVPPFPLERYAGQGAVGLLVPGAGPTVTRESALAALVRGKVRSSLLPGKPAGPPLLELDGRPRPVLVYVSLPPPGRSENDVRYPIAVVGPGFHGLLTSTSTRIPGLVSVADIATGRLRSRADADPVPRLERLERRIDRNDRFRLPATILVALAVAALAFVRPRLAARALLVALAANLWLAPWLAALAGLLALVLPLGGACAAILLAYLVSMGLDAETVALSPLGPSQAGRFYGVTNLLETLLLVPALLGTTLLRRTPVVAVGVAALALVAIGGNRFGADGGGLVVLAAGLGVLWLRLRGRSLTPRLLAGVAVVAAAGALLLLGLDAATGGSSHVTRAVGNGPASVVREIGDRLELSVRRTLDSTGASLVMLLGLAALAGVATRKRRDPLTDAYLAALAVSLVLNDTPADVVGPGAACAFLLFRLRVGG